MPATRLSETQTPQSPRTQRDGLSTDERRQFDEQGYLIVRGVFEAAEMAVLRWESQALFERRDLIDSDNLRCRWQDHASTGECLFDCFDPVIDIGPVCRAFAEDERMLSILSALYDDQAHLFKDKLIFKPPGAKGYALHQDYISWKEFPSSYITAVVPIDETNAANGATEVFPGQHRQGYLSTADGDYHELAADSVDPAGGVVLEMRPGDVALFGGYMPHRSGANSTAQARRQLYLSYNAARDGGAQREAHYAQFHQWLRKKYAEYGRTNVYFR